MCKIDELGEELAMAAIQALTASIIFGLGCGTFYPLFYGLALGRFTLTQLWAAPKPSGFIAIALMGLVSLVWLVWHSRLVWRLHKEIRNWRFGMRGEQAVAEKLADPGLAAAGFVAFHDVPGNGKSKWNIDHVVVGPGGIFVLETKARPRRKTTRPQEENEVRFDGRRLQFPWCHDDEAPKQVQNNVQSIRRVLSGYGPKDLEIQPVIVLPGWYVKAQGNYTVKAMNATYLIGYIKGAKQVFTPEQLAPIKRRLEEECRVLEF